MGVPCSQHLFKGWALLQSPLKWVGLGPKAFQKSKILSYIHTYIQGGCWVYFAQHHGLLLPAECIPLHKCLSSYHYITFQPIVAHPGCSPCWSLRCLPQTIHTKKACFWVVLHRHSRQPKGPLQDVSTASVPQANGVGEISGIRAWTSEPALPVVSKSGCETTNKVLSVKCYERQIVRRTIKNCPTDNLKLSEKNRQRDNSLEPVVSKSGCETSNEVLSVKCYERQIVRKTIKNCQTDNLKLSDGQFKIVRRTKG